MRTIKPDKQEIIIDVGANAGDFAIDLASRNPGVTVLAIEPVSALCQQILDRAKLMQLPNINVLSCAIDINERLATFNVSDHDDCGVSSLLGFDTSSNKEDSYWQQRSDLYFDKSVKVEVKRLDSILNDRQVSRIRFIKIDAQGVDIGVLDSLGSYLDITDAGMLEVPATLETHLYSGEDYDLTSALAHLEELGFRAYAIKPNDHAANEYNVFFCRKDTDYRDVEERLGLKGIPLYDGKHFWHLPSDKLEQYSSEVQIRLHQTEEALRAECAETARLGSRLHQIEDALRAECAETARLGSHLHQIEDAWRAECDETARLGSRLHQSEAVLLAERAETARLGSRLHQSEDAFRAECAETARLRTKVNAMVVALGSSRAEGLRLAGNILESNARMADLKETIREKQHKETRLERKLKSVKRR